MKLNTELYFWAPNLIKYKTEMLIYKRITSSASTKNTITQTKKKLRSH